MWQILNHKPIVPMAPLQFGVGVDFPYVVVQIARPVEELRMTPELARDMARLLRQGANQVGPKLSKKQLKRRA